MGFVDDLASRLASRLQITTDGHRATRLRALKDVVGRFVMVGKSRYRLEMPLPFLESRFDILELEKR